MKKNASKISVLIVAVIIVVCGILSSKFPALEAVFGGDLEYFKAENGVHFIDVGQGDAALVKTDDANILIDAGPGISASELKRYLDNQNVTTIDYFITTHPHEDHIGGADDVIYNYQVKNVIMPYIPESEMPTTKVFENMLDAIEEKKVNVIQAKPGDKYDFGEDYFEILGPVEEYKDLNMLSVITRFSVDGKKFVFTGDAEKESELDTLREFPDLSADVLKVSHHGSSTSSDEKFIKALSPDIAIISCGEDNNYGHPHDETVDLLEKYNIDFYRTDEEGGVVITIENNQIYVNGEAA